MEDLDREVVLQIGARPKKANETTIKALETLKPTMVTLGIVNEQITDAAAFGGSGERAV